jgi:hypothetical protein
MSIQICSDDQAIEQYSNTFVSCFGFQLGGVLSARYQSLFCYAGVYGQEMSSIQ